MSVEGILEALGSEFSVSRCRKSGVWHHRHRNQFHPVPGWCSTDTGIRRHRSHTKQSLSYNFKSRSLDLFQKPFVYGIWMNVTTSFFLSISPTFSTLLALGLTSLIPPGTLAAYGSSWCWVLVSTECLSWICFWIFFQTVEEFGRCHSSGSYVCARLSSLFGRIRRKLPRWLPWSRAVQCWGITSGRSELGDMEWVETENERQRRQRKDTKQPTVKPLKRLELSWARFFDLVTKIQVNMDLIWSTLFDGCRIRRSTCHRLSWVTLYRFMTDPWLRSYRKSQIFRKVRSFMSNIYKNCGSRLPMKSQALSCWKRAWKRRFVSSATAEPTRCALHRPASPCIALHRPASPCPGNDAKLPCDGILLQGSLIVNESMLTGWMLKVHGHVQFLCMGLKHCNI